MVAEYKQIVDLMHKANEHLQYPKIKLKNGFMLSLAGGNARFPKSINITDGKPYGSNIFYGRITTAGTLSMPNNIQPDAERLQVELGLLQIDPANYAKGISDLSGSCMFCRKQLNHPQSVAVGYGPTCAANYGLPWGDIDPEIAKAQATLQFDLPKIAIDPAKEGAEKTVVFKNTDYNANRINCDCGHYPPNMECLRGDKCKRNPVSFTAEQMAIEKLRDVAIIMLSDAKHEQFAELIEIQPDDEYMLLVTALWENL